MKGKVIFITGASSGIGRETAFAFAKEGARVALTYHKHQRAGAETRARCLDIGAQDAALIHLDVTDSEQIQTAVQEVVNTYHAIDVLINNAAVIVWEPLTEQNFAHIEAQVRTNLEGLVKMTRASLPHITDTIINIASIAGRRPYADLTVYSATKCGVRGFTKALAKEQPHIHCYIINPDATATQMTDFRGRPPSDVASVILRAARGDYNLPSGSDINVWDYVK